MQPKLLCKTMHKLLIWMEVHICSSVNAKSQAGNILRPRVTTQKGQSQKKIS